MNWIRDFHERLIPYLPFIIFACAAITAVWHIEFYW
jgi:hypothetical protein